jgi:uncharacterized protein YndB with AHSA1/START domain
MHQFTVDHTLDAPAARVFEAWTKPELMKQWWAPASFGISFVSCEIDARTGGSYRFVFSHPEAKQPMAFFGKYLEVIPNGRLVWTNDEEGPAGAVTTVTFEERDGKTLLTLHDLTGSPGGFDAQFEQLDALLAK